MIKEEQTATNEISGAEKTKNKPKAKETATPKTSSQGTSPKPKVVPSTQNTGTKMAVILVRGLLGITKEIKDTLFMMNLRERHNCVIIANNSVNKGMIAKVKDYVTYGEISESTEKLLEENRPKGNKKYYALHPPRGGFERKGTKKTYLQKGALGPRGPKINDLIKKMI